jgi:hypothetical protein
VIIRSAVIAFMIAAPAPAADVDPPPRWHKIVGTIEGTEEALAGSVRIDLHNSVPSKFNVPSALA